MIRVPDESLTYTDGYYYLDGKPFTGIAYFVDEDGGWVSGETEFKDGLESGIKREWAGPEKLIYEATYRGGDIHGTKRRWLRNGDLTEEGEYEYGIPLREKTWDEDGKLIDDYELKQTDANYKLLQKYRLEEAQTAKDGPGGSGK